MLTATGRYSWDKSARKGKGGWVLRDKYRPQSRARGVQVMGDIEPYPSIVTGEVIGGRRQHREHLKAHDLEEIGNEHIGNKRREMPPAGQDVKRAVEMVQAGYRP